eukprot:3196980-Prymnesium_polylepis.1
MLASSKARSALRGDMSDLPSDVARRAVDRTGALTALCTGRARPCAANLVRPLAATRCESAAAAHH